MIVRFVPDTITGGSIALSVGDRIPDVSSAHSVLDKL
jgi:hypothetical protein